MRRREMKLESLKGLDDASGLGSRLDRRCLALWLHQAEPDAEDPVSRQNAERH